MDDDVQYLGTNLAEPPMGPPQPSPSTTGITLHVEHCGDKPAHDLTFYRANASHVNIGRKSGSDDKSMRRENDHHNAVFTCQVVSAKHAKLLLSDSGQVHIVDLRSRHGTHLLRRGETTPRMLPADVPTLLADGDVITFGKVVGAGSYHVSPITVRVELLTSHPVAEPPADRASTPTSPVLLKARRLSSGRYGLLLGASCAESDSSPSCSSIAMSPDVLSSQSEQESDVEDEHVCIPTLLRDAQGKPSVKIPAFRSFFRDLYNNTAVHSPVILDVSDEPLEDDPATPPSPDAPRPPSPVVVVIEPSSKSRSHSPIEVATSSPSSPCDAQQSEPAVIGAWPASRPDSPRHCPLEVETSRPEAGPAPEPIRKPVPLTPMPSATLPGRPPLPNDAFMELMHRLPPPPPFFAIGGPFSTSISSDFGLPSMPPPLPPPPAPHRMPPLQPLHKVVTECVKSEVKGTVKNVEDHIAALQREVTALEMRETSTEEDVVDFQERIEKLEVGSEELLCRIGSAERNIASLSTMQGQMTALHNQVTTLRERADAFKSRPIEIPIMIEGFKTCTEALNGLVSEMKLLREDVEKRIEDEMEAIQNARTEALDVFKEVAVQAEFVRSSKRKRDDVEAEEEEAPAATAPSDVVMEPVASPPVIVQDVALPDVSVPQVPIVQIPVPVSVPEVSAPETTAESPRPKKRVRTAVHSVARTAAAMAIGAAATWSALAFS